MLRRVALACLVACSVGKEPVRASIVAGFLAPRGLLDGATALDLGVFEGGACDEATGIVEETGAREIASAALGSSDCDDNVTFCGDVSVAKGPSRVFAAKAIDNAGEVVAIGCTTADIEQDAVTISIEMRRFLPAAVCGDDTVQPTEQCEPGGTDVCDDECQSNEILLSVGASGNDTSTGKAGDKTAPFFLWPQATGNAGRFLAFYTDRAVPGGNVEVGLRVMSADLSPASSPPALANGSIFLPNGGSFPPAAAPRQQSLPQAAVLDSKYYVVFQDDDSPGSSGLDIHLRTITSAFQSEQGERPLSVNGGPNGEPAIQTAPAIAASSERLLIVWEDQASGTIAGRTFSPPSTFGSQNRISSGSGNERPQVATLGRGWAVVWKSDTGIKLRVVGVSGTPSGAEQTVDEGAGRADGVRVASLDDGRFAVVWSKGGDIFVQRFDERGVRVKGDQSEPLNDLVTDGAQTQPTIAGTPARGGSYVVAWHDASTGHIRARFLGGSSGFLFNHVDGQSSEFQASRRDDRERAAPAVAVGGSGPFVAIGWEDRSSPNAGIVVRRFPLPE